MQGSDAQLRRRGGGRRRKESGAQEDTHLHDELVSENDEPRIPAASSAFSPSVSSSALPAAPPSEEMKESDLTSPPTNDPSSTKSARLAQILPPDLRQRFEQRRDELLSRYPDIMTRDYSEDGSVRFRNNTGILPCRLDTFIFILALLLLAVLLYAEYGINLPIVGFNFLRRLLDPGPIQYAERDSESMKRGAEMMKDAIRRVQQQGRAAAAAAT